MRYRGHRSTLGSTRCGLPQEPGGCCRCKTIQPRPALVLAVSLAGSLPGPGAAQPAPRPVQARPQASVAAAPTPAAVPAVPQQTTALAPPSVGFGAAPALSTGRDGDTPMLELAWRRCLPAGCIANGVLGDDALNRRRGWAEPGRITFQDGAGRAAGLPSSPRSLAQALDTLASEDSG